MQQSSVAKEASYLDLAQIYKQTICKRQTETQLVNDFALQPDIVSKVASCLYSSEDLNSIV